MGEGNKIAQQTYFQSVASGIVDILLMICLTFLCTHTHIIHAVQEFHTSAEEMRHNLLAIYQKLGKSFDVGDIAARFSYVYKFQQIFKFPLIGFETDSMLNENTIAVQRDILVPTMMTVIQDFRSAIPVHLNYRLIPTNLILNSKSLIYRNVTCIFSRRMDAILKSKK